MLYIYSRGKEEQDCLKRKAQELGSKEYVLHIGELGKLLQKVKADDVILTYEADRLFDSHYELRQTVKRLRTQGVRVYDFYRNRYINMDEELGLRQIFTLD